VNVPRLPDVSAEEVEPIRAFSKNRRHVGESTSQRN
jgi:hypothetical protein